MKDDLVLYFTGPFHRFGGGATFRSGTLCCLDGDGGPSHESVTLEVTRSQRGTYGKSTSTDLLICQWSWTVVVLVLGGYTGLSGYNSRTQVPVSVTVSLRTRRRVFDPVEPVH